MQPAARLAPTACARAAAPARCGWSPSRLDSMTALPSDWPAPRCFIGLQLSCKHSFGNMSGGSQDTRDSLGWRLHAVCMVGYGGERPRKFWNLAEMQTANRSLPFGFGGAGMVEGGLFSFLLSRAAGKFMYIILWLFLRNFLYFCKPRSAKFL